MKTSFSVKVTGSITVSIEPSNEDEDGGGDANGSGGVLEVVLASYMKSLVNDAIKKYATTVEEEEDDDDDGDVDLSSPLPQRRIPADADDSVEEEEEEEEASVEEDEDGDEAGDLPNVRIEYDYADENNLSQKMNTLNLRRRH
jgi:hypothetical protein